MQYRLKLASCTAALIGAAATAQACGHLPFDELPDQDASATLDGSNVGPPTDASSGGPADGFVQGDARNDGGERRDARPPREDAEPPPDAGCAVTGDCHVIYVSSDFGEDKNAGTSDRPVKTLQAALKLVNPDRNELHVATGKYDGRITLAGKQNILMFGGFNCPDADKCTWGADPAGESLIVGTGSDLGGTVLVGDSIDRTTIIKNFHIKGSQGNVEVGNLTGGITVSVVGGTPTFQNVTIDGPIPIGGSTLIQKRSVAVLVTGKQADTHGVLFDGCRINGGSSSGVSAGILVEDGITALPLASQPSVEIINATKVKAGQGSSSYGVLMLSSGGSSLRDSFFQAGPTSLGSESETWAVVANGNVELLRNRINVGIDGAQLCNQPKVFCGGLETNNANAMIQNNVILGVPAKASAALLLGYSDNKDVGKVILNSNYLEGGGSGSAADNVSAAIAIKDSNLSVDAATARVRNNILLGGKGKTPYGVLELDANTSTGRPAAFDHNAINSAIAYHLHTVNPAKTKDYTSSDLATSPPPVDGADKNLGAECPVDTTFHLKEPSPCIDVGTDQDAPVLDFDNQKKPSNGGWEIGPDETPAP